MRLVSKKELSEEEYEVPKETPFPVPGAAQGVIIPVMLDEGSPTIVDKEDFQFSYVCKHCGRQWSEIRSKEIEMRAPEGYKGD